MRKRMRKDIVDDGAHEKKTTENGKKILPPTNRKYLVRVAEAYMYSKDIYFYFNLYNNSRKVLY